jgi:hypothetical protein
MTQQKAMPESLPAAKLSKNIMKANRNKVKIKAE